MMDEAGTKYTTSLNFGSDGVISIVLIHQIHTSLCLSEQITYSTALKR